MESRAVRPVESAVINAIVKHLPPSLQAMVRLHELTGARSGELCLLRVADIERRAPGEPWYLRPARHKTAHHGHYRAILIGPEAQAVHSPILDNIDGEYVFSPARAQAEHNRVQRLARKTRVQPSQLDRRRRSPNRRAGVRWTSNSYRHALDYATKKAIDRGELPPGTKWHPHQLRHNAATRIREQFGLDAVVAVGYRVRSPRGTQFRQLAPAKLSEYLVKGFVMDDERLWNSPGPGMPDNFDELLERIGDICASKRRLYLRVREILSCAAARRTRTGSPCRCVRTRSRAGPARQARWR